MFYVYQHMLNGETIYIGKGRRNRIYARTDRNKQWREMVGDGPFDVKILAATDDEDYALKLERQCIKHLKPKCNVSRRGYKTMTGPQVWAKHTASLNIALPPELLEEIKQEAKRRDVGVSEMVRNILKRSCARKRNTED